VKGNLTAGQFGKLDFEFKGLYADVCDAALPAAGKWLQAATVDTAGASYVVGDVLTVAGGTASTAATARVTEITPAGGLVTVKVLQVGLYSADPTTNANVVTGGTGTGGKLDLTLATNAAAVWLATIPPLFTSSGTTVGSFSPVFDKIDFDLGNTISRREDANSTNGVKGFIITAREPKLSINPESVLEGSHTIWGDLMETTARTITAVVGSLSGNRFQISATGISQAVKYGDRSGSRTQEIEYAVERATLDATAGNEFQLKFY